MAAIKEVLCKDCAMIYPIAKGEISRRDYNDICLGEGGARWVIDGNKSPYENIAFLIPHPLGSPSFPMGDINKADQMLESGTTCFVPKP